MKQRFYQFWFHSGISLFYLVVTSPTQAQIEVIPDTTLPNNSKVELNGSLTTISEGTQVGKILFHSFAQFSVNNGSTVNFNNLSDIQNIISRVTGSSISNIDGTIKTEGGANLFLINPNGIVFGPNASLNIGGSFIASTASSINFADGTSFSATAPQTTPLLIVSVPNGLQFGENVGEIRNQSRASNSSFEPVAGLQVQPSKTLALIGGNVILDGRSLTAPDGRIELGGLAASGTVGLNLEDNNLRLSYPAGVERADVSLANALVDVAARGEGSIVINARNLDISSVSTLKAGIGIGLEPVSDQLGDITLDATENITITKSFISNQWYLGALGGTSGNILIKAGSLSLNEGNVSTNPFDPFGVGGAGGNVLIDVRDQFTLTNQSKIFTETFGLGNSGDILIKTGSLSLTGFSQLRASTFGQGNAGRVSVQADNSVDLDQSSSISTVAEPTEINPVVGNGGEISIQAESLSLKNGSRLSTSTAGGGRAGDITLKVSDLVNLDGSNSGLFATTEKNSTGDGGNIFIDPKQVIIRDGAEVNVSSQGSGDAGDIEVIAGSVLLDDKGKLTASSASGNGGNIKLQDLNLLLLRDQSQISTNASRGSGNGGDINIDTDVLVGVANSDITATAIEGRGGNIQINTQEIFGIEPRSRRTSKSDITASSDLGVDGRVEINRPEAEPSSGLVNLPTELVDVSRLIAQGCGAGGGNVARGASQFVATGRGGLPPTPTEALRSDSVLADLGTPVQSQNRASAASPNLTNSRPTPLVEAQGWVIGSKGEVVLTAQAPTIARIPWLTPTSCNAS